MKKKIRTTHYSIYNYWKDYGIDIEGKKVLITEENYLIVDSIVNDWGEPECWCCKKSLLNDDCSNTDADYKKIWNHKSTKRILQRCHIIPSSLGGTDEPHNLFLLCDRCHRMYPNTLNYDLFFIWHRVMVNNFHEFRNQIETEFLALSSFDYSSANMDIIKEFATVKKYNDFSSHGGIVNESTILAILVHRLK